MVCRGGCRVAAVVPGYDQNVLVGKVLRYLGDPPVNVRKRFRRAPWVVTVAAKGIEVNEVREYKSLFSTKLLHGLDGLVHPVHVALCADLPYKAPVGKYVPYLADPHNRYPLSPNPVEEGLFRRPHGK